LAQAKGVMQAHIEVEVRNRYGRLITKRRVRSHSFVKNLLAMLRRFWITQVNNTAVFGDTIDISPTEPLDTSGVARGVTYGYVTGAGGIPSRYTMRMDAQVGEVDSGIRVGTGTDTPTVNDVQLGIPILHGSGAGELSHGAVTLDSLQVAGGTVSLKIIRTFTNNSGSSIDVKEIGLHLKCLIALATHATIMIARDVLGSPVTVPNGATLTVRYILSTTV